MLILTIVTQALYLVVFFHFFLESSPKSSLISPQYACSVTSVPTFEASCSLTAAVRCSQQMVRASGNSSQCRLFNLHFRGLATALIGTDLQEAVLFHDVKLLLITKK